MRKTLLFLVSIGVSLISGSAAANTCSAVHRSEPRLISSLQDEAQALRQRLQSFLSQRPEARLVEDVPVKFEELQEAGATFRGALNLVVISLYGKSQAEQAHIQKQALEMMGESSISFPLEEAGPHLYVRYKDEILDYDYRHGWGEEKQYDKWRIHLFQNSYRVFHTYNSVRALEPIISLSGPERVRLDQFIAAAKKDVVATLGRFRYSGTVFNSGNLLSNVPPEGTGNNCTSWLMNAPLLTDGQSLLSGLGPRSEFDAYIATNPGWLMGYLTTQAHPDRLPATLLWTKEPLEQALQNLEKNGLKNWNFDPH